jgi:hypothetical protein
MEAAGIVADTWLKIETELKEKKAFDKQSAINVDSEQIKWKSALQFMEEGGFIGKTADGKFYLTQKSNDKDLKGFSINIIPPHTVVRFSRNK